VEKGQPCLPGAGLGKGKKKNTCTSFRDGIQGNGADGGKKIVKKNCCYKELEKNELRCSLALSFSVELKGQFLEKQCKEKAKNKSRRKGRQRKE